MKGDGAYAGPSTGFTAPARGRRPTRRVRSAPGPPGRGRSRSGREASAKYVRGVLGDGRNGGTASRRAVREGGRCARPAVEGEAPGSGGSTSTR